MDNIVSCAHRVLDALQLGADTTTLGKTLIDSIDDVMPCYRGDDIQRKWGDPLLVAGLIVLMHEGYVHPALDNIAPKHFRCLSDFC